MRKFLILFTSLMCWISNLSAINTDGAYNITVQETTNGTVEVPKSAMPGATVEFTISADEGYELSEFYILNGDDQLGFNADENSFVMPENDVVVVATFQKAAYSIFYPETDFGGFDAPAEAHKGDTVIMSAYFTEGYGLEDLVILYMEKEEIAYDTISENTFRFIMPDGEVTVEATFIPVGYNIYVYEADGGTIEVQETAQEGETVKFKITVDEGYELSRLVLALGNEELDWNTEDSTFVMPAGTVEMIPEFTPKVYEIFYTRTENVDYDALSGAAYGEEVIVTPYHMEEGYELVSFSVIYMDKEEIAFDTIGTNMFRFIMPMGEVVVTATFTKTTDVQEVSTSSLYTANGRIYYNGDLRIFDLLGRDVTADNGSLKGVYVVRTEEGVKRVVVK